MGKRSRQRHRTAGEPASLGSEELNRTYTDEDGNALILRGVLSPGSRSRYAEILRGGSHQEDAWQRAVEFLFEQLAVAWTVHDVRTDRPKELLARYRAADPAERRFVRDSLRSHLAELFPEMEAP